MKGIIKGYCVFMLLMLEPFEKQIPQRRFNVKK